MTFQELKKFNLAQMREILLYKWYQSEMKKKDIGIDCACFEWIDKYAKTFREYWSKVHG